MLDFDYIGRDMHSSEKSMLTMPHPKEISRIKSIYLLSPSIWTIQCSALWYPGTSICRALSIWHQALLVLSIGSLSTFYFFKFKITFTLTFTFYISFPREKSREVCIIIILVETWQTKFVCISAPKILDFTLFLMRQRFSVQFAWNKSINHLNLLTWLLVHNSYIAIILHYVSAGRQLHIENFPAHLRVDSRSCT
jgi:hypothetical protein